MSALVRSRDKAAPLLPGARLVEGDARDPAGLARALQGCRAVISALGPKLSPFRRVTLLSEATRALIAAMAERDVRRLVCITGLGTGDSAGHGGVVYDWLIKPLVLRTIYQDKDRQEALIQGSGLDWVIVRPSVLTDEPATGRVRAITNLDGLHGGQITRADVAAFTVAQTDGSAWLRKTPVITEDTGRLS